MHRRRFRVPYRAAELNAGVTMAYHPVTGRKLRSLSYCDRCCCYYFIEREYEPGLSIFGLDATVTETKVYLPMISVGQGVDADELYPAHWKFDPFLGALINDSV